VEILDISPRLTSFTVAACTFAKNKENPLIRSFWNVVETEATARFE
jgi:hypothetical protein